MINSVRDWMTDLVVFIDPNCTVTDALEVMRKKYISSLIVRKSEESPEIGIITSIDICDKIVAHKRDPSKLTTREIMSSPLITVSPEMTIHECARVMKENRIHHLPVQDENGEIIGMISANDFLLVAEHMGHGNSERALR